MPPFRSHPELYRRHAGTYAKFGTGGTFRPAFSTLRELIQKHVQGNMALDVGTGSGRSARFLKELGLQTTEVDISREQIKLAREMDPQGKYHWLNRSNGH
ncbi:MAG: methyltransferase domain-containing protein [Candidatus Diapherotrites archaeon]|nr:methyltransferase domain-containing protein [Candidatus Diapherotrites archaeon]